ncbi:hypothetical protein [Pseudomonas xantholysinigenes]|uniref:Uncharacterized protein n=1 Tax=Pseudomonas xantholysinigenes TaxID=2745490 RepID=A0A9E6PZH1_9PSED|nr:hypothetical protein [Pseudomonas xantholysinigenes]QXI40004.1 hypothetical protein HU772_007980 [Pseudomonas xantholysinigenes]
MAHRKTTAFSQSDEAPSHGDEFTESLRELMGWYGKTYVEVIEIAAAELARGRAPLPQAPPSKRIH